MWDIVTSLPPGAATSTTFLARRREGDQRLVVLREVFEGSQPFWPEASEGVVPLIELTELGGKRYAAYAWVPGVTLKELVEALQALGRPVPLGLAGRVVRDAARAMASVAPMRSHDGLSDTALLVSFDGVTRVLDFGAPRPSRFSAPGRPGYTGDVFSLAAALHSSLTGFGGVYADTLADGLPIPHASATHDECTPALDDVLQRGLSRTADGRQPDVEQLADELDAVLGPQLLKEEEVATLVRAAFAEQREVLERLGERETDGGPPRGIPEQTEPGGRSPVVTPQAPPPVDDQLDLSTRPRVKLPARLTSETAPRLPGPIAAAREEEEAREEETRPRTRIPPVAAEEPATTATEDERRRAKGQERIPTPSLGTPAAAPADTADAADADAPADTAEEGDDEGADPTTTADTPPRPRSRLVIALLLVLMAAGLSATAILNPQKLLAVRERLGLAKPPPPEVAVAEPPDPGPNVAPDGGGLDPAADGGEDALAAADDGGVEDDDAAEDAGAPAPQAGPDAGAKNGKPPDNGKPPKKKPPKRKPPKKKHR